LYKLFFAECPNIIGFYLGSQLLNTTVNKFLSSTQNTF